MVGAVYVDTAGHVADGSKEGGTDVMTEQLAMAVAGTVLAGVGATTVAVAAVAVAAAAAAALLASCVKYPIQYVHTQELDNL